MKKLIIFIVIILSIVLTGCDNDTIRGNIPENVSDEQVQSYVDNNYPEYSEEVSKILEEKSTSSVAVEDIISESLNNNINGMIDVYEDIDCWINVTQTGRQVLIDLRCYNSTISDEWSDINSSMYLLGYVLEGIDDNLTDFLKYGTYTIEPWANENLEITFDYYNEKYENVQRLAVSVSIIDNKLYLDGIQLFELMEGVSGFGSYPPKNTALYKSEYFPFDKLGIQINKDGTVKDSYVYVG